MTYRSIRDPSDSFRPICFREHFNIICDNETRVEADTKLSNNSLPHISLILILKILNVCLRARLSYCAQVVNNLISCHADTRILKCLVYSTYKDSDRPVLCVGCYVDVELLAILLCGSTDHLEALLLKGVRAVGEEFSHKDFLICVNGFGDNVQQLLGLSLKLSSLGVL